MLALCMADCSVVGMVGAPFVPVGVHPSSKLATLSKRVKSLLGRTNTWQVHKRLVDVKGH
jgi:hypothetical protein